MRRWMLSALLAVPSLLAAQNPPPRGPGGPGGPRGFLPDTLRNLKVLPASTTPQQILPIMQNIAGALGVRCDYCHVERPAAEGAGGGPPRLDFAADDKRTKLTARIMMRMVRDIAQRLDSIPQRPVPNVTVTCATCHRGVARPAPLGQVLLGAYQAGGMDSARALYRSLHDRYYGRASYDFGEPSLIGTAVELVRADRPDDALALLRLNAEQVPQSAATHDTMGDIALAKGDTAGAVAHYREALQRDSTDRAARFRLRALGGAPGGAPSRP